MTETGTSDNVIKLGRVEGIDTAEELLLRFRTEADHHGDVQLDGSDVISLDSTTLQMLVSFIQQTLREGASVSWVGVSAKLKKAAALLGLTDELHI